MLCVSIVYEFQVLCFLLFDGFRCFVFCVLRVSGVLWVVCVGCFEWF